MSTKGQLLSSAIATIDDIRSSLDFEKSGESALSLASLCGYIERQLVEANVLGDATLLDDVSSVLKGLKSDWDSIPGEARQV